MEEDGTFDVLPKKEVIKLRKEKERLQKFLGGIENMESLPSALFIVDPKKKLSQWQKLEAWKYQL